MSGRAPATWQTDYWQPATPATLFVSCNHFNSIYKFNLPCPVPGRGIFPAFSRVPSEAMEMEFVQLADASIAVVSVADVAASADGVAFILALLN